MNYQTTSMIAYEEIKPQLGSRQAVVLDYLKEHEGSTNTEIAQGLQIPINTVTPRCLELRNQGLVMCAGKRECKVTHRLCLTWRINNGLLF